MDEQTGKVLQDEFAYIINAEKGIGIETGKSKITYLFHHGGTVSRAYDGKVEATQPKDKKYLELKAKYYGDISNKMYLFYPAEFKKDLDNNVEI